MIKAMAAVQAVAGCSRVLRSRRAERRVLGASGIEQMNAHMPMKKWGQGQGAAAALAWAVVRRGGGRGVQAHSKVQHLI